MVLNAGCEVREVHHEDLIDQLTDNILDRSNNRPIDPPGKHHWRWCQCPCEQGMDSFCQRFIYSLPRESSKPFVAFLHMIILLDMFIHKNYKKNWNSMKSRDCEKSIFQYSCIFLYTHPQPLWESRLLLEAIATFGQAITQGMVAVRDNSDAMPYILMKRAFLCLRSEVVWSEWISRFVSAMAHCWLGIPSTILT